MIEAPSITLALAAGFVSFVSPCCLPLVPGYLAMVRGPERRAGRGIVDLQVVIRSLLFVGTFSFIFVLFGLSATAIGDFLFANQPTLNVVAGALIIAMGLFFVASVWVVRLNRDFRPGPLVSRAGRGGPVLGGAAFAVAWTPCVGPTLGAILGLASTQAGTAQGGVLLGAYSAGLALPFLLSALAFDSASRVLGFFKRHHAAIQVGSGAVLMAMGVLVLTGELFRLNIEAQQVLERYGLNFFRSV